MNTPFFIYIQESHATKEKNLILTGK